MTRKTLRNFLAIFAFGLFTTNYAQAAAFQFGGIRHDLTKITSAAGTTILTKASLQVENVTGSTTQTIQLPAASTLAKGYWFTITDDSTGAVTVNDGSGATLGSLSTGQFLTAYLSTPTGTAGTWTLVKGGGGSGGATATTQSIAQTAHGFVVGQWLYYTGSAYALAKADSDTTSEVVGVVSAVTDANDFTLLNVGQVTGLSGLVAGTTYYLSDTAAGALTSSAPYLSAHVNKPLLVAYSTTAGYAIQSRGFVVGSANGNDGGVKFTLENALPNTFTAINGAHYQQTAQTLSIVYLTLLNSGSSGTTTVQVNQYRNGSVQGTATASIAANASLPNSAAVSLSVPLSLIAGDVLSVDLTASALSASDLTVEWGLAAPPSSQTSGTLSIVTKTTSYALTAFDDTVIFNCSAPCTATLQASASAFAKIRRLKNISAYPLTVVSAGGSDTFEDGSASLTINPGIAPFPAAELQPDGGTQWYAF